VRVEERLGFDEDLFGEEELVVHGGGLEDGGAEGVSGLGEFGVKRDVGAEGTRNGDGKE